MWFLVSKWILIINVYLVCVLIIKDDIENGGIVLCLRFYYYMFMVMLFFYIKLSNLGIMFECMIVWEFFVYYGLWLNNMNVLIKFVFLNWFLEIVLEVYWWFEWYFEVSIGFFLCYFVENLKFCFVFVMYFSFS